MIFPQKFITTVLFWLAGTVVIFLAITGIAFGFQVEKVEIVFNENMGSVSVTGLHSQVLEILRKSELTTTDWSLFFALYTNDIGDVEENTKPAVLGRYRIEYDSVTFYPRFPLVKGMTYLAKLNLSKLYSHLQLDLDKNNQTVLSHSILIPEEMGKASTFVTQVYPTTNKLPENQLKFYIYFSAPMSRGDVYRYIYLLDSSGKKISSAFLELEPELWDANTKRLTLFFDPGRIKRGLRPHHDLGMALHQGQSYRLVISQELIDAENNPLKNEFEKTFVVGVADRTSPDYKQWQLIAPKTAELSPLTLEFDEPLDYALLGRMLEVKRKTGEGVSGKIVVSNNETKWQFVPDEAWISGDYILEIDTAIEDLAGNKLNRLFDVDHNAQDKTSHGPPQIVFDFSIPAKQ